MPKVHDKFETHPLFVNVVKSLAEIRKKHNELNKEVESNKDMSAAKKSSYMTYLLRDCDKAIEEFNQSIDKIKEVHHQDTNYQLEIDLVSNLMLAYENHVIRNRIQLNERRNMRKGVMGGVASLGVYAVGVTAAAVAAPLSLVGAPMAGFAGYEISKAAKDAMVDERSASYILLQGFAKSLLHILALDKNNPVMASDKVLAEEFVKEFIESLQKTYRELYLPGNYNTDTAVYILNMMLGDELLRDEAKPLKPRMTDEEVSILKKECCDPKDENRFMNLPVRYGQELMDLKRFCNNVDNFSCKPREEYLALEPAYDVVDKAILIIEAVSKRAKEEDEIRGNVPLKWL